MPGSEPWIPGAAVVSSLWTAAINLGSHTQFVPGRYRRLDLFIQVLRHMCPNLTDAS